jgi:hypothetical protein
MHLPQAPSAAAISSAAFPFRSAAGSVGAAVRQAGVGAACGLLVFLLLEPAALGSALQNRAASTYEAWRAGVFLAGGLFGGVLAAGLAAAEEWYAGAPARAARRALLGGAVGALLAMGYSVLGNAFYAAGGLAAPGGAARAVGWSLFGLGAGLGAGLVTGSRRRAYLGCLGGLAGGLAGGASFELLLSMAGGWPARAAGYSLLGAAIGYCSALLGALARHGALVYLTGAREGRVVPLYADRPGGAVLGRDELADVPLFGDGPGTARPAPRQAIITLLPHPVVVEVGPVPLLQVDGIPVRSAALRDGSVLAIGSHRLRFHGPAAGAAGPPFPASTLPQVAPLSHPSPAAITLLPAPSSQPTMLREPSPTGFALPPVPLELCVLTGPLAGTRLPLEGPEITLGRDEANTLPLPDARVSRRHARLVALDGNWVYVDLQSRNGSFLNGLRILRAGLIAGDRLRLGETVVAVLSRADPAPTGPPTR